MSIISLSTYPKPRERPPPLLHYLDVWEDKPGILKSRSGTLEYKYVQTWLSLSRDYNYLRTQIDYEIRDREKEVLEESNVILRLVSCDSGINTSSVGCGQDTLNQIVKAFRLDSTTEDVVTNNNGAYARYFTQAHSSQAIDTFSVVLKFANSVNMGYESLSLRHNLKKRTTRAFLHGLLDSESERLIQFLVAHIEKGFFKQPLILAYQLYTTHRKKAERYRFEVDESLHRTEIEIGYAIPGILKQELPEYARDTVSLEQGSMDLESVTRRLHAIATELGAVSHASKIGNEIGRFLLETGKELEDLSRSDEPGVIARTIEMMQKVEFEANMYKMIESQVAVLKDRVQNHINLTFSLIAQDDNRINRAIAEESALIALASKRDSTAMKTIALLTVVFLPPTFVATFFAMPMFNTSDSDNNSTNNDKSITQSYWLYWVVAIPLTVFVMVIWRIWLTFEHAKYNEGVRVAKNRKWKNSALDLNATKLSTKKKTLMARYSEYQEQARRDRERRSSSSVGTVGDSQSSRSRAQPVQRREYVEDYSYDS